MRYASGHCYQVAADTGSVISGAEIEPQSYQRRDVRSTAPVAHIIYEVKAQANSLGLWSEDLAQIQGAPSRVCEK